MNHLESMFQSHPQAKNANVREVIDCIQACLDCEVTCNSCADACLSESDLRKLVECIRLNLDCADVCGTAARALSRRPGSATMQIRGLMDALQSAVRRCEEECRKHASHHEHCRICAESCRRCVESCERLLSGPLSAVA